MSTLQRFYFDDGETRRKWSIQVQGATQMVHSGKIGGVARKTKREFDNAKLAKADTQSKVEKKLSEGFIAYAPESVKYRRKFRSDKKLQAKRVQSFEQDYGYRIPSECRSYLLGQNGGYPEPGFISIPGHPAIENVEVCTILGLDCDPGNNIRAFIEEVSPALPKDHFPIAEGRDLFSVAMRRKRGAVYFWDLESIDPDDVGEDGSYQLEISEAYLLASSFDEFLTRIAVYPDDKSTKPS